MTLTVLFVHTVMSSAKVDVLRSLARYSVASARVASNATSSTAKSAARIARDGSALYSKCTNAFFSQ